MVHAHNPRRHVQLNDDSDVDLLACPCSALLDGIPGRIPSDPRLSSLWGLRVSRYPRGYAFTSTLEEQELHLHGEKVVKDREIFAPIPYSLGQVVVSGKRIAPACCWLGSPGVLEVFFSDLSPSLTQPPWIMFPEIVRQASQVPVFSSVLGQIYNHCSLRLQKQIIPRLTWSMT